MATEVELDGPPGSVRHIYTVLSKFIDDRYSDISLVLVELSLVNVAIIIKFCNGEQTLSIPTEYLCGGNWEPRLKNAVRQFIRDKTLDRDAILAVLNKLAEYGGVESTFDILLVTDNYGDNDDYCEGELSIHRLKGVDLAVDLSGTLPVIVKDVHGILKDKED